MGHFMDYPGLALGALFYRQRGASEGLGQDGRLNKSGQSTSEHDFSVSGARATLLHPFQGCLLLNQVPLRLQSLTET